MMDQVIDAMMAQSLHRDAARTHPLPMWIVLDDDPDYANQLVARLVTDVVLPYILVADTLTQMHAQLPPDLMRSERQPEHPPGVVEVWHASI